MNPKLTRLYRLPRERQLLGALPRHLPPGTYTLLGTTYSADEIAGVVEGRVAAMEDVTALRATLTKAIAKDEMTEASTRAFFAALRELLYVMHGASPDVLFELALPARKGPVTQTIEALTEAAEKRRATRRARHTMGKRQRAKITGETAAADPAGDPADNPT